MKGSSQCIKQNTITGIFIVQNTILNLNMSRVDKGNISTLVLRFLFFFLRKLHYQNNKRVTQIQVSHMYFLIDTTIWGECCFEERASIFQILF